jgi:hypothetical protein
MKTKTYDKVEFSLIESNGKNYVRINSKDPEFRELNKVLLLEAAMSNDLVIDAFQGFFSLDLLKRYVGPEMAKKLDEGVASAECPE